MKPMRSLVLIFALAFLLGGISACGPVKEEAPEMTAEASVVFPMPASASPVKGIALRGADEAAVLELAAALVESGLKEDGYDHIVLSDWQSSSRAADNTLRFDRGLFPGGEGIIQILKDEHGIKTGLNTSISDLTGGGKPGSLHFETLDAKTFAKWGVSYVQYDYSHVSDTPRDKNFDGFFTDAPDIIFLGLNIAEGATAPETVCLPESAALTGGAGLTDEGRLTGLSGNGGTASFKVNAEKAGRYMVTLGFAGGKRELEHQIQVIVNGGKFCVIEFPRTGAWHTKDARAHGTVWLEEGENEIMLKNPVTGRGSAALLRYDYMMQELKAHSPDTQLGTHGWAEKVSPEWAIDQTMSPPAPGIAARLPRLEGLQIIEWGAGS